MSQQDQKNRVGKAVAKHELIKDGAVIGVGTGSTIFQFIEALGELVAGGLKITAVVTSEDSKTKCDDRKIPVISVDEAEKIDIAIDGADEVDPKFNLIKGGGGAHVQEKAVDYKADYFVVIVDGGKMVTQLGAFKLPIEVEKDKLEEALEALGKASFSAPAEVRMNGEEKYETDNENYIIDVKYGMIQKPEILEKLIEENIPGVVKNGVGIFTGDHVDEVWIGTDTEVVVKKK
ncbi:MAG: ribose-5-phosphate isomerase RpiA [Candidatus Undinarchaeales archaeon]|jgi:ribose 5-phosphate isomerase A|nr:ribose-5-phosphate isomerase RpiA [Candidatus Undinarchaeales archaeon]